VIDWVAEMSRAKGRRFMVRLVKGAYWDGEIKHTQVGGHDAYPVFTSKAETDRNYMQRIMRGVQRKSWPLQARIRAALSSSDCTAWASPCMKFCVRKQGCLAAFMRLSACIEICWLISSGASWRMARTPHLSVRLRTAMFRLKPLLRTRLKRTTTQIRR